MEYLKEYKIFKGNSGIYNKKDPDEPFFNINKGRYKERKRVEHNNRETQNKRDRLQTTFNMTEEKLSVYLSQLNINNYGYSVYNNNLSFGDEPAVSDGWEYTIIKYDEDYFILELDDNQKRKKIKSDNVEKLLQYIIDYEKVAHQSLEDDKSFDEEI